MPRNWLSSAQGVDVSAMDRGMQAREQNDTWKRQGAARNALSAYGKARTPANLNAIFDADPETGFKVEGLAEQKAEAQRKVKSATAETAFKIFWNVSDEATYQQAKQLLLSSGAPREQVDALPPSYDPNFVNLFKEKAKQEAYGQPVTVVKDGKETLVQFSNQGNARPVEGYAPSAKNGNDPSAVQEYNFFQSLTPEQRQQFITLKRATPPINLGDRFAQPDPLNPGQERGAFNVGLPPAREIDTKGGQVITVPAVPGGAPVQAAQTQPAMSPASAPTGGASQAATDGPAVQELPKSPREAEKEDQRKQQRLKYARVVSEDIDRAVKNIEEATIPVTGFVGGVAKAVPGTTAYQVAKLIDTVKANAGFDRLQEMRAASPTGGALGQVSDFENKLLQATIGNLEQAQKKEDLLYNLRRVKDIYLDIIHGPGNRPEEKSDAAEKSGIKFLGFEE